MADWISGDAAQREVQNTPPGKKPARVRNPNDPRNFVGRGVQSPGTYQKPGARSRSSHDVVRGMEGAAPSPFASKQEAVRQSAVGTQVAHRAANEAAKLRGTKPESPYSGPQARLSEERARQQVAERQGANTGRTTAPQDTASNQRFLAGASPVQPVTTGVHDQSKPVQYTASHRGGATPVRQLIRNGVEREVPRGAWMAQANTDRANVQAAKREYDALPVAGVAPPRRVNPLARPDNAPARPARAGGGGTSFGGMTMDRAQTARVHDLATGQRGSTQADVDRETHRAGGTPPQAARTVRQNTPITRPQVRSKDTIPDMTRLRHGRNDQVKSEVLRPHERVVPRKFLGADQFRADVFAARLRGGF